MGQLAPVNFLDLIALAEAEGRPRSLERSLSTFVERIASSVLDLPVGPPWDEFLRELEDIPGHRVPHRFRRMLEAEAERSDRQPDQVRALLSRWAEEEPQPFQLGQARAKVTRAMEAPPVAPETERARATRPRSAVQPRPARVVTVDDRERMDWVAETVLERVRGAGDKGLGEQVLVAGVRHRAREVYPTLTPGEITTVLRELKDSGRVRFSAGRWSAPARW